MDETLTTTSPQQEPAASGFFYDQSPKIRRAERPDYPSLVSMCRAFFAESGCATFAEFDEASLRATLDNLMAGDAVCLVAEVAGQVVGTAAAMAYPFYFNTSHKTGQELFWWLNHEHRGSAVGPRLFRALEEWARGAGCQTFSMVALDALKPEQVGALYRRAGYRPTEHSYIKEL